MKIKLSFVWLLAMVLSISGFAKEISVLTIGNSFANSVFDYLPKVVESAGDKIILERANIGGCSLERHWRELEKSEADPTHKPYDKKFNLREKLESRKWDYVTIQQVSTFSWQAESYEPYASNLCKYIEKYAPGAEIVMHQTWAYRFDDGRLKRWKIEQREMYERLTGAYNKIAAELKLRVIPSGDAVQLARETQATPYVPYDPETLKNLKYPAALPSEKGSFVRGLRWTKDKNSGEYKIGGDSSHLNKRGEYLQACVWYAFFFEKPTSEIKFVPAVVDGDDAEFLRQTAQKALDARRQK